MEPSKPLKLFGYYTNVSPSRWILLVVIAIGTGLIASCRNETDKEIVFTDIAYAYHGLLLDSQLREIKLDKSVIEKFQESMIESLTAQPQMGTGSDFDIQLADQQNRTPPLEQEYVREVLSGFNFTDEERILTKHALIQMGIDSAPANEKIEYKWRYELIIERSLPLLQPMINPIRWRPEFGTYINRFNLGNYINQVLPQSTQTAYMAACRSNAVPIPPDWPTDGWVNHGELSLEYNFLSSGTNTEVWTYEATDGVGLCYALPRKDEAGNFELLGIICQSNTTGKACFWDNIDATTGNRITNSPVEITRLKDGANLAENCTDCHRGYNVFLIHQETPLATPTNRNPEVRYSPIGQPGWSNPPPLAPLGAGACSYCHEIPEPNIRYCPILRQAAEKTMPPREPPDPFVPAGWETPRAAYRTHINFLKERCP